MDHTQTIESLASYAVGLKQEIDTLLERAYRAGYAAGSKDAAGRILAAAEQISHGTTASERVVNETTAQDGTEAHPNSAEGRTFPYGAVTNAFRDVLIAAGRYGRPRDALVSAVEAVLGSPVSEQTVIDTIKRLKRKRELVVENGIHRAGPELVKSIAVEKRGEPDSGNDGELFT